MTTEKRLVASALSPHEVKEILGICSRRALLVGGQALAFWADRLSVAVPEDLVPTVTADADFIGDSSLAEELGERLGWKTWLPSIDDATPNTGKVTHRVKGGGIKQVDFLSGVAGLTTKDIARRAVELEVPEIGRVRILHPVDVLDSRIQNLHLIPEKRTRAGVAQAKLAVDVVRAYIDGAIADQGERAALKLLERVVAIADDIAGIRVFLSDGIDPLLAVPLESFRTIAKLHTERWPRITSELAKKRAAAKRSLERSR